MADVARHAGVSAMTVSNVVNGRSGVSADTRLRVQAAVAELGYQMNLTARHLRAGRTGAVGLVVPELDRPYFGQLAQRLADGMERLGKHLVVERGGASREGELAAVALARLRMHDAVVLSVVGMDPADVAQLTVDLPIVLIGERPVPQHFDHVAMDNVEGARSATAHLLASGARRIALLGGRRGGSEDMVRLRTQGYLLAHEEAGIEVDERLLRPVPFSMADGREAVLSLYADGVAFDAVFALTDTSAMGALRGLSDLRFAVPSQVQVIGFDNIDEGEYLVPTLSTVDPGHKEMVDAIVRLVDERLSTDRQGRSGQSVVARSRLALRGSTR